MGNKQYWQSLEELEQTPEYKEAASKEFQEELPVFDYAEDITNVQSTGRRDFLKMLGFSVSAAAIATSCKIPVKKAIPYVFDNNKPYNLIPGIAEYFASTYMDESGAANILVKTREGRPIKLEGNVNGSITKGGTSARLQASVLGLYDHTRAGKETIDWKALDKDVVAQLDKIAAANGKVVVLSNTLASPVMTAALGKLKAKYTNIEQVVYDPISLSALREANAITLGEAIIPSYHFDKAEVIVGINCDFLGSWLSPIEFAEQYGKGRVPSKANGKKMSRHYQFQSNVTISGSAADYKYAIQPSQEKAVLINLYNAVASGAGAPALPAASLPKEVNIKKVATDLLKAQGKALVVCGSNDKDAQLLTNAINIALGSYGNTIDTAVVSNMKAGNDEAFLALVDEMKAGSVKGLILLNANPAYNSPFAAEFEAAMSKMDLTVSLADRKDETAQFAKHLAPGRHFLESWNILEPKAGHFCFVQPTINPVFEAGTRPYLESILTWAGAPQSEYDFVKSFAETTLGLGALTWIDAIKLGGVNMTAGGAKSTNLGATVAAVSTSTSSAKGLEVVLYQSVGMGDGSSANNPFVQEFPDPISRLTWDNYIGISYEMAKEQGLTGPKKLWTNNNNKTVPTATVSVDGKSFKLPVLVQFGLPSNTVSIALGYGRKQAGRAADGVGVDVFPLVNTKNKNLQYTLSGATIEFHLAESYKLGLIQVYGTLMEEYALPGKDPKYRGAIVKETNLASYQADSKAGNEDREKVVHHLTSLYPGHEMPGHHWGMGVDLNSCIGCGACVVACNIENNVPIVGKTEVFRGHDMHWMRIDRYYSGDRNNPDVSFQPMMCQHCDNAPCENVCPVNATNHSTEGLNQMAYNRCIGTRYCANNCPYKVRRFNWLDYQAADYFGKFNDNRKGFGADGQTDYMYEDLTRMVLNPDVTVRSRGVIEKCSFCVQRIQEGKLAAKKVGKPLEDGAIKTACQTSCPTHAISFGDLNDKNSQVHQLWYDESGEHRLDRNYHVLEEQHFLPSVGYQVKIRNIDEATAKEFTDLA
jgi:MoCo/4Fe-4S cofactor protein with predicted Tat translocation signal